MRARVASHSISWSPALPSAVFALLQFRRNQVCSFVTGWRFRLEAGLQLSVLSLLTAPGQACTVPVFRYALDRWPAETWTLEAPRDAFFSEPLASALRNLGGSSPLNLTAKAALDVPAAGARLFFPDNGAKRLAWSGILSADSFRLLTDSPARQNIARRILAGDSLVWVIVQSPDTQANEALTTRLQERLAFVQNAAELPVLDPSDPSSRLGPGPELKLSLTQIAVRRDDSAESAFITMLAGPAGAGLLSSNGPFAAVVFGRGRVLGAWSAGELTDARLDESTLFATRACSCEVKSLHPGWDLLMNVDWDAELRAAHSSRHAAPAIPLTESPASAIPVLVPIANGIPGPPDDSRGGSGRWWMAAAAGAACIALAASMVARRRARL